MTTFHFISTLTTGIFRIPTVSGDYLMITSDFTPDYDVQYATYDIIDDQQIIEKMGRTNVEIPLNCITKDIEEVNLLNALYISGTSVYFSEIVVEDDASGYPIIPDGGFYSQEIGNQGPNEILRLHTANNKYAVRFLAAASDDYTYGNVKSISVYYKADAAYNCTIRQAIYSDSGGAPDTLLGITDELYITGNTGWRECSMQDTVSIADNTYYWITVHLDGDADGVLNLGTTDNGSDLTVVGVDLYSDGLETAFGSSFTEAWKLMIKMSVAKTPKNYTIGNPSYSHITPNCYKITDFSYTKKVANEVLYYYTITLKEVRQA